MMKWLVKGIQNGGGDFVLAGECELKGETRVITEVPEGITTSVTASLDLPTAEDEHIFMNGYQTWTYCPEYTKNDRIRGVHGLPKAAVDKFSLDRYGDYHFVKYPYKKGILHGFSYCWFRDKYRYLLIASLDETPGYTQFTYDASQGKLYLKRDCSGIACAGDFHAFDLVCLEGTEDEVFDEWFRLLGVKPIRNVPLRGYSSWYNRYENIDSEAIANDLAGCRKILSVNDLFQIDDGWEPAVGDWLKADTEKFPGGMKREVERIHEAGFQAGIWVAPFVAEEESETFRKHPDWFVRVNGQPWKLGCNWSGFYGLDIDHPEVRKYLEKVFRRIFDEWGFDLVKLDFLYGAAAFGTRKESRAARMIRAMKWLREMCGDHAIIGCGVPVMPAFGLVDYCRISCDVTLDWNDKLYMQIVHRERPSTKQAVGNIISRRQLNGRAYLSDPDVFFLREENCKLTEEEKTELAKLDALLGGAWLTSDDPGSYTPEMRRNYWLIRRYTEAQNVQYDPVRRRVNYELDGYPAHLDLKALLK
ncbi:MAG: alpha-galactosidase [Erysipelotrichaceae bacterium]|nr:alpha-galactosidase [Erysipelotrichaceae bacterium]